MHEADMGDDPAGELTQAEVESLRRLAGVMLPSSQAYRVPGADDPVIFADIIRSLGRDAKNVRKALAMLQAMIEDDFATIDASKAQTATTALLADVGPEITALGRAVLQCYYRADRVLRSLGLEPRAPFPNGHALAQGDWSLLEAIRGRPPMWRDVERKAGGQ
jgi:hypothetical protein